jgi:ADP-dependent NAD(P)H-hydrate dehydratase / NAD(P)H-hydrate epimerase
MNGPTGPAIRRVLPAGATGPAHWPLHGAAASRALEQDAARALPPHTLMQRAGLAVCRLARAVAPHAECFHVVAGPGNNGGDGFEAAMWLRRAGHEVHVRTVADLGSLPADAAASLARAREAGVPISPAGRQAPPGPRDLVIDALLGLGVSRPPEGAIAQAIAALNDSPGLRLAVDLPSGLPSDTGHPASSCCVRAHHTLSLLSLKPGLFTAQGRDHAGEIWFCDLGVEAPAAADTWLAGPPDAVLPPRRHAQHKGSFGNVVVIGGAPGMTGAALLAARSALRRGAGRVFVQLLDAAGIAVDPTAPELMFRREIDWQGSAADDWTAVCGCGGGEAVHTVLPAVLSRAPRLVLDADALNAVATDPALQALLVQRSAHQQATVLTPHPLEAARLLGCQAADVQADRLARARELARRFGAMVLLKGSGSVIAAPDGRATINPTGNALLATAGTGDVLAGWVGALWAQGATAEQAAIAAAFQHGAAAEAWTQAGPAALPRVAGSL